jgi:hypothetical protein
MISELFHPKLKVEESKRKSTAKSSQGGDMREAQVSAPCLSAIPAFDRIVRLINRLNYNRGIGLLHFKVRLRTLTEHAKDKGLGCLGRKSTAPKPGIHWGVCGRWKGLISVASSSKVNACVWVGGESGGQYGWTETVHDWRNCNRRDSDTLVISHVRRGRGRKRQRKHNAVGYARTNVICSRLSFVIAVFVLAYIEMCV